MAKIQLIIDADDAADLTLTLRELSGARSIQEMIEDGEIDLAREDEPEAEAERPQEPGVKRTRRTKAQIKADEAAKASGQDPKAIEAIRKTIEGDPFADAPAAAAGLANGLPEGHPNATVSLDSIKAMVQQSMEKIGALATQNLLKEHAAGASRPSEIKAEHYGAVHAALAQVI